jgi:urease accessory protein
VTGRPGVGRLDIVRHRSRSVVARAYAASPLRLLTPRNHGRAAWVYTGSYGGGLVSGDALHLTVRVAPEASAFVSTQASTKVYRSPGGTSVEVVGEVEAGARLVVWPDPVVCFAGSNYEQDQRFELKDASAALVLVDWMTSGRRESGERWRFDRYSSRLAIRYDGRLVLRDSLQLSSADGDLASRMGRFDVLATAVVIGRALGPQIDRILADVSCAPIERRADRLVAASPFADFGCIVRVAGRSAEQVGRVLRDHLSFVSCLLGDDPWARKW